MKVFSRVKWFGDWERSPESASKVVDENGEPKVVYHGTSRDFSVFDRRMAEEVTQTKAEGEGIFFADRRIVAASYGRRVLPAFLNLRTPYVNESSNTWRQMKLSNGKTLTGAPPIAKRGHLIVPADEVPPEATAKEVVQGGEYVSVEVPYPTLASINQVAGWAEASGFDGIIAHDIFDMGSDVGERVKSTTYVTFAPAQVRVIGSSEFFG